jgi:glutaredoxin
MLILYSRPSCHLCERAQALLAPLCRELGVALSVASVEDDPRLEAAYGERIPVLVRDGVELLAWPFDRAQASAVLQAVRR